MLLCSNIETDISIFYYGKKFDRLRYKGKQIHQTKIIFLCANNRKDGKIRQNNLGIFC